MKKKKTKIETFYYTTLFNVLKIMRVMSYDLLFFFFCDAHSIFFIGTTTGGSIFLVEK